MLLLTGVLALIALVIGIVGLLVVDVMHEILRLESYIVRDFNALVSPKGTTAEVQAASGRFKKDLAALQDHLNDYGRAKE